MRQRCSNMYTVYETTVQ